MGGAWRWAAAVGLCVAVGGAVQAQDRSEPAPGAQPDVQPGAGEKPGGAGPAGEEPLEQGDKQREERARLPAHEVSARELLEALARIADQQAAAARTRGATDDAQRWQGEAARLRENAKIVAPTGLSGREFAARQEEVANEIRLRAEKAGDVTIAAQAKNAASFWSDIKKQLDAARSESGPVALRVRVPGPAAGPGAAPEEEKPTAPSGPTERERSEEVPAGVPADFVKPGAMRKLVKAADTGDAEAQSVIDDRVRRMGARAELLGMSASGREIFEAARQAAANPDAPRRLEDERLLLSSTYRADASRLIDEAHRAEMRGDGEASRKLLAEAAAAQESADFLLGK
jgi:hypothetical protein